MRKRLFWVAFTVILLSIAAQKSLNADIFDLSYTLTEGGFKLELSPINQRRGLRIRVNSDINTRYEIIQRIVKPLENKDNPGTIIRDNFVVYGLRGTNRSGTLRLPVTDTPVRSEEILYTSDTSGSSDSFTIIYGLTNYQDLVPGEYLGRIGLILNAIGANRSQVSKILEVRVLISQEASQKPGIEITTASGSKVISLNPKQKKSFEVLVKINRSSQSLFSISQLLSSHLESQQGERIDFDRVEFAVKDVKGSFINSPTPLSLRPQKIYASNFPEADTDLLIIIYKSNDLAGYKFGKYISQINYLLEEKGAQTKIDTLRIELENERIFDLVVTPQGNKYNLEFPDLSPLEAPKKDEVTIEIKTNLNKPYQVTQKIYSELINKEGGNIPSKYFTFYTQGTDTKGKLEFTDKSEVKKGETILFISDERGSPDKFKITYELTCPEKALAGDYSTRVTYSLLEM